MRELRSVVDSLLPPDSVPPAQEDLEVTVVGSQRKVSIMGYPTGAGMPPSEPKPEQQSSLQDELNELNPNLGKQHGVSPHAGHGQGRAHLPKHTMF